MARFAPTVGRSELRDAMTARAERSRQVWVDHFGTEDSAFVRKADELADRWRSDEPVEVSAWELPRWFDVGFKPHRRVVVLGTGAVIPVDVYEPGSPAAVVDIASHRSPRPTRERTST